VSEPARYEPSGWGVVRAPLLPIDYFTALSPRMATQNGDEYERAYRDLLEDPRVQTALTVGSLAVVEALQRSTPIGADSRLARTLHNYLVRMSSRPTPYGLFAGVGLATWGQQTDIAIGTARPITRTRIDMKWLAGLVAELEADPRVRRHLCYVANPTILVRAGRVFASSLTDADSDESRSTVSVRATRLVRLAVQLAQSATPHTGLVARLVAASAAPASKVEGLVEELWTQQILLTDLRPPLTRSDPARYVYDKLDGIAAAAEARDLLQRLHGAMGDFDSSALTDAGSRYRRLITLSRHPDRAWSTEPPQVDTAIPLVRSRINHRIAKDAARAAEILLQLTPPVANPIAAYRERFVERYGTDRQVPLLELLDPNFGLGSPYIGEPNSSPAEYNANRTRALLSLATDALTHGLTDIDLDESALAKLSSATPTAESPPSLDVSVFVLASSSADIDNGDYQLVIGPNLGAGSAGRTFGRFADILGQSARDCLADLCAYESAQRPGVLGAELVYLPGRARLANVAIRPHFRDYEIAVGTAAGLPVSHVIPLDELSVVSPGGKFRIWWTTRDAEVMVTAGHMLHPDNAPEVCRFLSDVGHDAQIPFRPFDWGPAAHFPALPRVRVDRIVLCAARYSTSKLVRDAREADSTHAFAVQVDKWRARWQVPRYIYVGTLDNRLLIDLDSAFHVNALRLELRRFSDLHMPVIEEALPDPDRTWLPGPGGRYVSEIVVPVVRSTAETPLPSRPAATVTRTERLRPPGSDWLYVKLYCPPPLEDDVLIETTRHFCQPAADIGLFDQWFFIRYSDPEPHLRLRFHGRPAVLTGDLYPRLCAWGQQLIDRELCLGVSLDTYEREVERYGGAAGIGIAETIFAADSVAVVELLALRNVGPWDVPKPLLAAVSSHDLLEVLGWDTVERRVWCQRVTSQTGFSAAPGPRRELRELRNILSDGLDGREKYANIASVLAARRAALTGVAAKLDRISQSGGGRIDMLDSYVHMHCNRLFGRDRALEVDVRILLAKTLHGLAVAPPSRHSTG
jgi:thiopeptide-type bacteriocin biosynthesis protein